MVTYTTRRGKRVGHSRQQDKYMHVHHIDHTHIKGKRRIRFVWRRGRLRRSTWTVK